MEELITMNAKEQKRAEVFALLEHKSLLKIEAARQLGISTRHLRRLYKDYKKNGIRALISKRRGKPSNNKLKDLLVNQIVTRIQERYADFGPTLAHEKLTEEDGFSISISSIRNIMIREGIYKPKRSKKKRIHPRRERRSRFGELVQIDGSPHDWFEGRREKCCLIVFIDDATSQLLGLRFVEAESLRGYFLTVKDYLSKNGKPRAFYSDKHGIFRVNHGCNMEERITQFGRAMKELDIKTICAHSPEAKGRVERANGILQDRLVKELRLQEISTIEAANAFLPRYMEDYNRRFSVEAQDSINAHRSLDKSSDLERILSIHDNRKVSKTLSFQFENTHYQIIEKGWRDRLLIGQQVDIYRTLDNKMRIFHKSKELDVTRSDLINRRPKELDAKTLNPEIDRWLKKEKQWIPPKNHPYRRFQIKRN